MAARFRQFERIRRGMSLVTDGIFFQVAVVWEARYNGRGSRLGVIAQASLSGDSWAVGGDSQGRQMSRLVLERCVEEHGTQGFSGFRCQPSGSVGRFA